MTIMRAGPLAAGVLLGLISAAAATDPPVSPASPAGGQPITLTDAQLDEIAAGGCVGCPPPRNPFPANAMGVVGGLTGSSPLTNGVKTSPLEDLR